MKSVLINIQPKWVEKICKGKKTIEVRKSRPKIDTPFKCYIYMSQGAFRDLGTYSEWIYQNRMRVIGEFVCDEIVPIIWDRQSVFCPLIDDLSLEKMSQLDLYEIEEYLSNKNGYGWHISDLKIYDKPKELSEFRKYCEMVERFEVESVEFFENCIYCPKLIETDSGLCAVDCENRLTRPPQSWCYVEE